MENQENPFPDSTPSAPINPVRFVNLTGLEPLRFSLPVRARRMRRRGNPPN